jgi:hypothetical protein
MNLNVYRRQDKRNSSSFRLMPHALSLIVLMLLLLTGCVLTQQRIVITATPPPSQDTSPVTPGLTVQNQLWTDESSVVSGICFEAALDASGTLFIMRNAAQLIEFYDLADNSHFCRHPVTRYPFDFSNGRVLAGLWSAGRGCTAAHIVQSVQSDDAAKTLTIHLNFVTEGDCNYELVQPLWMGLDGVQDYEIEVMVGGETGQVSGESEEIAN